MAVKRQYGQPWRPGQGALRAAVQPKAYAAESYATPTFTSQPSEVPGVFNQFDKQIGSSTTRQVVNGPIASYNRPSSQPYTGPTYNYSPYVNAPPQQNNSSGSIPTNNIPDNSGTTGNGATGNGYENIKNAQDSGNADIDADYNQSMSMLGQQWGEYQGQAAGASAQITNDAGGVTTALGAQQATGEQGVQKSLSTAEASGKNALQQARDLFRQTQQSNNAQLSALGISSSSVSEALAERLGVETARRIAGVTGGLDEVRQNATNELGRIKNYAAEKATQLAENVRIQKDQIQQALVSGLNQINTARSQAASDKARARSSLLQQVTAQVGALTQQQQQFDQSLKVWSAQKAAALVPLTTNTGLEEAFRGFSNFTQSGKFDITKFDANMSVNAKGQPAYQFGTINQKKPAVFTDPITGQALDKDGNPI